MEHRRRFFGAHLALGVAALLLACATSAVAQNDRGTITGTVADSSGAVVPGASVLVTDQATKAEFATVTTATGNFTLADMPVGMFDLSVSASGFSKYIQTGIQVQVALTFRLDVVLKVGAATESVTVEALAPLLATESAEQSTNVHGNLINALPINVANTEYIRDPYAFITLSPGVSGTAEGATINGFGSGNFRVLVEGQDATSANNPGLVNEEQPSVEAVGEFTLQTSNFSAEFGQALSAVVNFTSRSGTNGLHGSMYEYFSNEALNSYTAFTHVRGMSRVNNPGFSVGGPVLIPKVYNGKNKTFFFFGWEFFKCAVLGADVGGNTLRTVPTDAYRRGDFSAALTGRQLNVDPLGNPIMENTIYDPASDYTVNGNVMRTPVLGNIIPASRIDPVAAKIQKFIPEPINANLYNNFALTAPDSRYSTIPTVKIDHNFTDTSRISLYWHYTVTDRVSSNDSLPAPITARRNQNVYAHVVRLNYDYAVTPTLLVHLGSGYVRYMNPDSSPDSVLHYDAAGQLGFTGAPQDGFPQINGISNGNFGGYSVIGMGPANANHYYSDKWTSIASATWVHGNHTIKTGGELKVDSWEDINSRGADGILNFSSAETGLPAVSTANIPLGGGGIGLGYASFLLGLVDNSSVNMPQDPQWRRTGWGLYLQDTWKVTRRLTLDYGLRWDIQGAGHEIFNRWSQFGPTIPNPSAGGLLGGTVYPGYGPGRCNCSFAPTYPYAIGPRFGAAYQINSRTVARLGWGVEYSAENAFGYITNNALLGVGYDQMTFSNPAVGEPAMTLKGGFSGLYNLASLSIPSYNPGIRPSPGQLNAPLSPIDPNGDRPSRVNQWNIGLQREIVHNLVVEGAYVGNRAVWVTGNSLAQMNLISDQRLASFGLSRTNAADRSLLASTICSPLAVSRGFSKLPYAGYPCSATVAQSLRPFPQFNSSLSPMWAPTGDTWYDSLQVKLTKRLSHGLLVTSSYTYQKQLGLTSSYNDMFNRVNQKRPNGPPQVFITSFTYRIPRWKQNKLVANAFGDWTLGGVMQYTSGSYIGIPGSQNNLSSAIFQGTVMNRVPGQSLFLKDLGCHCFDPNKDLTLNPAAWVDAAPGQWGTSAAAYSDYRGVRSANEQFNFGRTFRLREKMTFEIRAEAFNAFNRINWAGPSSGNPFATVTHDAKGNLTGGFGYIAAANSGNNPRNAQLVARFQF